jgi:hypothetical protein
MSSRSSWAPPVDALPRSRQNCDDASPAADVHESTLRPNKLALLVAVVLSSLGGVGCLRFGYGAHVEPGDAKREPGADDAGPVSTGGAGGAGGSSAGGTSAAEDSGSHDAAAGGDSDAGLDESDAGEIEVPTDAGTDAGGAAAADGGGPVVSPLCPERPGMLFCDGFEDPNFSRWKYQVSHNGTLTRSTVHAHSGTTSLLATTGPPAQLTEARWATEALAKQKSGDAWMRFYNWVPGTVVVTEHFSVGVMSETPTPYGGFELRILPSLIDLNATNGVFQGAVSFPRDRWVCVELHVFIDPSAGVYEAYLDGALAIRSPPTNTLPADGFTAAEVGVHFAGPSQGPVEVYVDDVVVGTSRIPCD